MNEKYIPAAIFLLYGLLATLKPEWVVAWQKYANKKLLGAKFIASKRTYRFYQGMGVLFFVIGLLILFL